MKFQKGQSGNPKGHARKPITDALRAILLREVSPDGLNDKKLTYAHEIALEMVKRARTCDLKAVEMVWERSEGKAPQPIVGDDDHPPVQGDVSPVTIEILKRHLAKLEGK